MELFVSKFMFLGGWERCWRGCWGYMRGEGGRGREGFVGF